MPRLRREPSAAGDRAEKGNLKINEIFMKKRIVNFGGSFLCVTEKVSKHAVKNGFQQFFPVVDKTKGA